MLDSIFHFVRLIIYKKFKEKKHISIYIIFFNYLFAKHMVNHLVMLSTNFLHPFLRILKFNNSSSLKTILKFEIIHLLNLCVVLFWEISFLSQFCLGGL